MYHEWPNFTIAKEERDEEFYFNNRKRDFSQSSRRQKKRREKDWMDYALNAHLNSNTRETRKFHYCKSLQNNNNNNKKARKICDGKRWNWLQKWFNFKCRWMRLGTINSQKSHSLVMSTADSIRCYRVVWELEVESSLGSEKEEKKSWKYYDQIKKILYVYI